MMTIRTRCLVDTSAVARGEQPAVREVVENLSLRGWLWTCRMVDLELIHSARHGSIARLAASRRILPDAPVTPDTMDRAFQIMESLPSKGKHRGAKPADCIIAAAAEAAGLTVLHYDRDFDRISEVTGQPTEWIAPPGSLDQPRRTNAKRGTV